MIVCRRRRNDGKPLATIIKTLGSVYRLDPVVPASMLALLGTLDRPAAYMIAAASGPTPPLAV